MPPRVFFDSDPVWPPATEHAVIQDLEKRGVGPVK